MIIAIDAEPANREKRTGVELVVFNLIKEFIKIEAGKGDRQYYLFTQSRLRADFPKLPTNIHHRKLLWPSKYFWTHIRLGLAIRGLSPDVTFVGGNIIPFFTPPPIVTIIHDLVFLEHPELHTGKTVVAHRFAAKRAVKRAHVVISGTQATLSKIKELFPKVRSRLAVVRWGVDHAIYNSNVRANDREVLSRFGLLDKKYFIFVGRLEAKKNIGSLLEAFRDVKKKRDNIELVLAGEKSGEFNFEGISVLGYQKSDVVAALFRHALAFVFPTKYEGFGLPVLEAQSCGCPVIVSDIPVLREVSGGAALFVSPDSKSVAASMFSLIDDEIKRQSLMREGLANAAKFNWGKTAREVLDLIVIAGQKVV